MTMMIKAEQLRPGEHFTTDQGLTWNEVLTFDGTATMGEGDVVVLLTTKRDQVTILGGDDWTEDEVVERRWLRQGEEVVTR